MLRQHSLLRCSSNRLIAAAEQPSLRRPTGWALPAMAPRSRSRASQAADSSRSATTIADLPEAVVVEVLGKLNLRERCGVRESGQALTGLPLNRPAPGAAAFAAAAAALAFAAHR